MLLRLREAGSLAVEIEVVWEATTEEPEELLLEEEELEAESDLDRFDIACVCVCDRSPKGVEWS